MTSPDLSPLLAVEKTRDIVLLSSRPRTTRQSWPYRTIRRTRLARVRGASVARTPVAAC
jgi:hypothetical protein